MSAVATLPELKKQLNLASNTTQSDDELQLVLDAATAAIEARVGPIVNREVTERLHPTASGSLEVSQRPLVTLTSVSDVWLDTAYDIAVLDVDNEAGTITHRWNSAGFGSADYRRDARPFEVVYTAGRGTEAPAHLKLAVLIVAEHLWSAQRGSSARPGMFGMAGMAGDAGASSAAEASYIYRGYALPRRALELIVDEEQTAIG